MARRRWVPALLVVLFLASGQLDYALTPDPVSPAPSSTLSSAEPPESSPTLVPEKPERRPPGSSDDSTLNLNCRRAVSLEPGERVDFRYSVHTQSQKGVGLLLSSTSLEDLSVDVEPNVSWQGDSQIGDARLRRLEFEQRGEHHFILRNQGREETEFTLVLLSLKPDDTQYLAYGRVHEGSLESAGDVDVYAIDVGDSVEVDFVVDFAAESRHGIALISSEALPLFIAGREGNSFSWRPKKPDVLFLALYADDSIPQYRLLVEQRRLEVLRPAHSSKVYGLQPGTETSIQLRFAGHGRWKLQVEELGEPFALRGELRAPGKVPLKRFRLGPEEEVAELQPSEGGDGKLILENEAAHSGRVRVTVSVSAQSFWKTSYFALLLGCAAAAALFSLTQNSWTGPFNHLHFRKHHTIYCFVVAGVSFVFLGSLLYFGQPFGGDLPETLGVSLQHLVNASGVTGFFLTLLWIYLLWKGRQKVSGRS